MITSLDKNTALILIDLQKGIVQYSLAHPIKDVLTNSALLVKAFRKAGLPIVVVNVNPAGAAWTKARKEPAPASSTPFKEDWLEITPEIETESGDIFITKTTWSAFYNTQLDEELKKRGITGVVMAGVSTSIGVEGTARSASERGYNVTFASDAMTDMFMEAHERSMKYIFPRMGEIDVTQKIIEQLG
ncbi:MAG: isochorismatase family protein [Mucilaginibacter sp.]|nr:isochorismatase family protein [Mucilaginibacter sp.]